jgi:uncharacterized membrane protein YgdD (TMEM256/DUF423 family)
MNKKILITASFLGFIAVIIGAFAAHGLKPKITVDAMRSFETGVRYQMYHALLLLFIGNTKLIPIKIKTIFFYLIIIGVLLFSGSIYLLATNALTGFNFKVIGFITPLGGLILIFAWLLLIINFFKLKMN